MIYNIDGIDYEVIIERKKNKNIYIRVKEDMKIHVTCNRLASKLIIKDILDNNIPAWRKMISQVNKNIDRNTKFFYLGKEYDIIKVDDIKKVTIVDNKIYTKDDKMLNKWYKDEIIKTFDERYVYVFNHFNENIKSPILKIRTMKSRWGVYNRSNHTITLNSKLIEYDISKIDYVIVHELSHILQFKHSKEFWNLVSKYCPDYKKIRRELKDEWKIK